MIILLSNLYFQEILFFVIPLLSVNSSNLLMFEISIAQNKKFYKFAFHLLSHNHETYSQFSNIIEYSLRKSCCGFRFRKHRLFVYQLNTNRSSSNFRFPWRHVGSHVKSIFRNGLHCTILLKKKSIWQQNIQCLWLVWLFLFLLLLLSFLGIVFLKGNSSKGLSLFKKWIKQ